MSTRPAVLLDQLTKTFRLRKPRAGSLAARIMDVFVAEFVTKTAVDRLSFSIQSGERVAFIGPNGAGKSTTLKLLSGILQPDSGTAEVLGLVPWEARRKLAFSVGSLFGQRSQLFYQLPARDTFALLARVYELSERDYRTRFAELVDAFELEALLEKPVRQLSLGERMRCEIACSLLHRPKLLFLDEPTIGLDVAAKAKIRELLTRSSRDDAQTLLLTSHDTGDIERVCDRVILIHRGQVLLDGPLSQLQKKLKTKRLTLLTEAEHLELDLSGVRVLNAQPHQTTLEVALDVIEVGKVVERVLRQGALRDLSIEDPPLDEVIRALYHEAEAKAAS